MRRLLTIHHPDAADDPYEVDDQPEGPGSLLEAVRAEFDVLEQDGQLPEGDRATCERAVELWLLKTGEWTDPGGVRWTLTREEAGR